MNFLSRSKFFGEKSGSMIRSLANTYRVLEQTQQRTEHTRTTHDTDEPIIMSNPFKKEKKVCILCKYNIEPDYKNVRLLSQFQSRYTGRIYGKHITGLCKKKQQLIEREIEKAQNAGMMPYYYKEISYIHDPKLFDIDNPFRPHKY
ncbi:small ribosomal subunit protein bS18m [Phymastichus coffea]|uniref:small ribosomal subunit protein bS18m n=1 Tax=Phymastichus coffea TaxID=108790 RepID=UPI00273B194C|nr:small ribosomal subunit protein bS18m [Phymastichus coffea]